MHVRSDHPAHEQEFLDSKKTEVQKVSPSKEDVVSAGLEIMSTHANFALHQLDRQGVLDICHLRAQCANLARTVLEVVPQQSRARAIAITKLQEFMWAAIASVEDKYPLAASNTYEIRYSEVDQ